MSRNSTPRQVVQKSLQAKAQGHEIALSIQETLISLV